MIFPLYDFSHLEFRCVGIDNENGLLFCFEFIKCPWVTFIYPTHPPDTHMTDKKNRRQIYGVSLNIILVWFK